MSQRKGSLLCLGLLAALACASSASANDRVGRFGPVIDWPLIPVHISLLPNGKVFSFGTDRAGNQQAYIYDTWDFYQGWTHNTFDTQLGTDSFCGSADLLPSGDVLIGGGDTRNPINFGIRSTNFFKTQIEVDKSRTPVDRGADMAFARWYPSLITLPSGEALIQGGKDGGGAPVLTPEIFDGNWRSLFGATNNDIWNDGEGKWFYPRSWVAPNGRVFGMTGNVMYFLDTAGNGGTQIAGYLPNKTRSHISSAVMYRPGQILQTGGSTDGDTQAPGSNQAITVDINSGWPVVQDAPNMARARVWGNATVLANGEVLVSGGSQFENKDINPAKTAEIWNPDSRQFRDVATAQMSRLYHSVSILLPDGSVLTGGGGAPGPYTNKNIEIYYPPYLFHGNDFANDRPTIGNFDLHQQYNAQVTIPYGGDVARVTLVRNGSTTHSFDTGQRFQELNFKSNGGSVTVSFPGSPNIAPPGYYMLFFINGAGVPSMAKIMFLGNGGGGPVGVPNGTPVTPVIPNNPVHDGVQIGNTYTLTVRASGRCLDIPNGSADDNIQARGWDCNNSGAQHFRLQASGQGGFNLVNAQTGKCLDIEWGRADNGTRILQYQCTGNANQSFHVQAGVDGSYSIHSDATGKCLDLAGGAQENGANLQEWDCFGGSVNQEFWFK